MKTYSAKKRVSNKLRAAINNTIETNEKYAGCYFWTKTGSAGSRRSQEKQFKATNPSFTIETKKGLIEVAATLDISCQNFYYSLSVTKNGKKSNVSIIKNMIK